MNQSESPDRHRSSITRPCPENCHPGGSSATCRKAGRSPDCRS